MDIAHSGFGTKAIHAGTHKNPCGALAVPIYQTSTFVFDSCEQGGKRFAGEENGFIYSRLGNPTVSVLEEKIAVLENADAAIATSSGMGAITSALWTLLKAGDHVVADETLYGCTHAYLSHGLTRYGVDVTFVDCSDLNNIKRALRKNTAVLYLETPANPTLKITDLAGASRLVHEYNPGIKVVCDNTFCSPYHQQPLTLGCDVVVHSATKYLNGHGDVVAGMIAGSAEFISACRMFGLKDMTGAVLGPFEAYLILRGLKTLEIRMERHNKNAVKVAEYLASHPKIKQVYYPGFTSHPGHDVAAKQMKNGFGAMIAFEVAGGRAAGAKLLNALQMCALAVSLGDAETLIEHPASMTHSPYSAEELRQAGISEGLVRLSVGLENVEDIIADLEQGLAKL